MTPQIVERLMLRRINRADYPTADWWARATLLVYRLAARSMPVANPKFAPMLDIQAEINGRLSS